MLRAGVLQRQRLGLVSQRGSTAASPRPRRARAPAAQIASPRGLPAQPQPRVMTFACHFFQWHANGGGDAVCAWWSHKRLDLPARVLAQISNESFSSSSDAMHVQTGTIMCQRSSNILTRSTKQLPKYDVSDLKESCETRLQEAALHVVRDVRQVHAPTARARWPHSALRWPAGCMVAAARQLPRASLWAPGCRARHAGSSGTGAPGPLRTTFTPQRLTQMRW